MSRDPRKSRNEKERSKELLSLSTPTTLVSTRDMVSDMMASNDPNLESTRKKNV